MPLDNLPRLLRNTESQTRLGCRRCARTVSCPKGPTYGLRRRARLAAQRSSIFAASPSKRQAYLARHFEQSGNRSMCRNQLTNTTVNARQAARSTGLQKKSMSILTQHICVTEKSGTNKSKIPNQTSPLKFEATQSTLDRNLRHSSATMSSVPLAEAMLLYLYPRSR